MRPRPSSPLCCKGISTVTRRNIFSQMIPLAALFLWIAPAQAEEWPPSDPNEGMAAVAITRRLAQELREAHELADVQQKAGSLGKREAIEAIGSASRAIYGWAGRDGKGRMRVFAYRSGGFAAIIDPAGSPGEIVLNSCGAFTCRDCSPPVNACGRRPSWIPHDLHWDNFDCPHTITGPQGGY